MRRFRITPLIVAVAGALVWITVGVVMYFLMVVPASQNDAKQQSDFKQNMSFVGPDHEISQDQLNAAQAKLDAANKQKAIVQAEWNTLLVTKNPHLDYSNTWNSWLEWWQFSNFDFAPRLNSFLKHTEVETNVTVGEPSFPTDPNIVPKGLLAAQLPPIQAFGSWNQIVQHINSWNRFSRIVMIDGLQIQGYNPFMTASYTATEYIFTKNADTPGPPVPSAPGVPGAVPPKNPTNFNQMPGYYAKTP